jgi:hypothetical protein
VKTLIAATIMALTAPALAQGEVVARRDVDFDNCRLWVTKLFATNGWEPSDQLATSKMFILKIVTQEANLTFTCSRPDKQLLIMQHPKS